MPTYRVDGAFRSNGEETWITLTAANKAAATARANGMGIVVADINLVPDAAITRPAASPTSPPRHIDTFAAPVGVSLCPLCRSRLYTTWSGPTSGSSALGTAIVFAGLFLMVALGTAFNSVIGVIPGLGISIFGFVIGLRGRQRMACSSCAYRSNI